MTKTAHEKIDRSSLLYRPCVGICLFNQDNKVFVGERIDTPNAWQMPQGGIDEGEDVQAAALRELKEEVGTQNAEILMTSTTKLRYELPDRLISSLWNGKYRGQEQTWIAARFMGHDSEINLNAFDPPEFSNWQWVELDKCIDLIVPFKKELYQDIIRMFSHLTK